ncbi:heterokaryon incompatibility protein-domain-containing protein [Lasiosphaeris hirsuta]|uniref:Heterokaryon incompatibility protein-domain-containing protein n=1 Tax=Lasiosphaeris hirsuta TaxID=260670 RepID=A0AA40DL75_9PEZI|nr:heterokaryon incompatibility protein-domain-containing protein [Lasiosphaeris hirsuta]
MSSEGELSDDEELLSSGRWVHSGRGTGYAYGKLWRKHDIRLLSIPPRDFNDQFHCELVHEDLNTLPLYDAISYTWADDSGDRRKNKAIFLGSVKFMVTSSCHLALQRARLHGHTEIWIDAVCINQDDTDERSHQVQLMAQIYAGARSVLVYIGEESTDSSEVLNHLAQGMHLIEKKAAVTTLLGRPYFWRVWILQEIALARKATLVCVPLALSFVAPEFRSIEELPRLLDISSFCEATDPRDKVYALLGLATGTEGYGFLPDYDIDLEEVYVKTAILIVASCGPLALLTRTVCRRSISPALPWVPDWRSYSPVSLSLTGEISILDEIR